MFNLENRERSIIIFLVCVLLLGIGIAVYKKLTPPATVKVENFKSEEEGLLTLQKININEAGIDELMRLKGVGKALAGRIIEYRDRSGRFSSAEEIKNVRGIGDKLFDKIKDRISTE